MRQHAQENDEEEINMTPMLDIVFIMLIFFIVTAVFVKEAGITVEKPDAINAERQKRVSILIGVTDADEIWINRQRVDMKLVGTTLERLMAENPRGTISIQADIKSKSGLVLEVMKLATEAGVDTVSISTTQR
jgi:biopolymer transport protein ExbD